MTDKHNHSPFTHKAVCDQRVIGRLDLDSDGSLGEIEIDGCPHCGSRNINELDYDGDGWVWECYDCGQDFRFTAEAA